MVCCSWQHFFFNFLLLPSIYIFIHIIVVPVEMCNIHDVLTSDEQRKKGSEAQTQATNKKKKYSRRIKWLCAQTHYLCVQCSFVVIASHIVIVCRCGCHSSEENYFFFFTILLLFASLSLSLFSHWMRMYLCWNCLSFVQTWILCADDESL